MLNHNIMNIILDKMAFNKWQNRVIEIHKELDEKYYINVDIEYDYASYNFKDDYDGTFTHIFSNKICIKCSNRLIAFNYRELRYGKMIYLLNHCIITNVNYDSLCNRCNNFVIQLPSNYW